MANLINGMAMGFGLTSALWALFILPARLKGERMIHGCFAAECPHGKPGTHDRENP